MFGGERSAAMRSPGIDALRAALNEQPDASLDHHALAQYVENTSHLKYLDNPAYNQYLKIHKVAVGVSGSEELVRIADTLSLIYSPLVKSMVVGNVTDTVRHQVFSESALLGKIVADELERYSQAGCVDEVRAFVGLAHEVNALNTMLYIDDPRYLPMPSSARADSGYYHPEQTHDMVIINQHWGTIKKVIPAEIKGRTSLRDRKRYKALLIRGKMHLSVDGSDPRKTAEAFYDHTRGVATAKQLGQLERISTDVREMLRLYQQGFTPDALAVNSITRFYSSRKLNQVHPEIASL